jgi:hypothetical protein
VAAIVAGVAAWCVTALIGTGCVDDSTGVRVPNQSPEIRITAGPIEDSLHIYRVTFHWLAEDADGEVVAYEYTTNGDTTFADSLRVTAEPSVSLTYTADDFYDTIIESSGGAPQELYRFGRHHTFNVRAVDDAGARSPFAGAAFFAITVAPTTQIVTPDPQLVSTVGHTFQINWQGEDLDGSQPPQLFATRLVPVPIDSLFLVGIERLDCESCAPPWTEFTTGTSARFDQLEQGGYLFGVRAMDEAGAVEPELVDRRNAMRLVVDVEPGRPMVSFSGAEKTIEMPIPEGHPQGDTLKTFELSSGQPTSFVWQADASHYGAEIVGHAYGIDLVTIEPDDPGWVDLPGPAATVTLYTPEGVPGTIRSFYIRLRDSVGQFTVYDVILNVGPPDFRYDILYVDDLTDGATGTPPNPSDDERDRLILEVMLAEAERRGMVVDEYEVQTQQGGLLPGAPDLTLLRKYKLLVWSQGSTFAVLNRAMDWEGELPIHEYLDLGGNLWLMGKQAMTRTVFGTVDEFFGFVEQDFGWNYFHIETVYDGGDIVGGGFLRPRGNPIDQRVDGLDGGHPTPAAAAEGWPELLVTRPPYDGHLLGIPLCEGMDKGYEHGFRPGDFDTLYTFITNGSRWPGVPIPSRLDDLPCAFRYAGPTHGKTMVFTFPVFWFSDGALDSLGTRAIEWFFDEQP